MSGLVKLVLVLGALFCVLMWATDNPKSAESIVENVEQVYDTTSSAVKDTLFDKDGE